MRIAVMLLAVRITVAAFASADGSLVLLIEQGKISLIPSGLGGHRGECLRVSLTNVSSTSIQTTIPAGWTFVSEKEGVQDLIVVRSETIALAPHGSRTVTCRAFCCEASQGSPSVGEPYRKGHPARGELIAIAQAVDSGRYDDDIVQNAVWVLSDGNDIGSMGAMDGSVNDRLRERVARSSKQALPLYTLLYAPGGARACSQRPSSIARTITFSSGTAQQVTVYARRDDGTIMEVLLDAQLLPAGTIEVPLHVDVSAWPPGRYAFHVHSVGSNMVRRLPFNL